MKVYLVSTGCHSDYTPRAIYSTKELALEANRFFGNENEVEEFDLDVMPNHPAGMYPFEVLIDQDGNVHKVCFVTYEIGFNRFMKIDGKYEEMPDWVPDNSVGYGVRTLTTQRFFTYRMWAKDEQHAVKIANERRAMAIANNFVF